MIIAEWRFGLLVCFLKQVKSVHYLNNFSQWATYCIVRIENQNVGTSDSVNNHSI